jgi:hypothetical protein
MKLRWVLWIAISGLAFYLHFWMVKYTLFPPIRPIDFFQEWSSAREFLEGRSIYPDLREAAPRLLGGPPDTSPGAPRINAHPPFSVVVGIPFARLDYTRAAQLWRSISIGLLVVCLIAISKEIWGSYFFHPCPLPFSLLLLLLSGPALSSIFQGQLNELLLALYVTAWMGERRRCRYVVGVALGIAAAIKFNPILLLGYFVLKRRWGVVWIGLITFLAANLLALTLFGPGAFIDYANILPQLSAHRSGWTNASLPAWSAKLLNPAEGRPLVPLIASPILDCVTTAISLSLVVILTVLAIHKQPREETGMGFGLMILGMLLIGPITWEHTLLASLIPLALLFQEAPTYSIRFKFLLAMATIGIWISPVLLQRLFRIDGNQPASPAMTLTLLSYQFYSLLILFGLAVCPSRKATNIIPPSPQTALPHLVSTPPA